PRSASRKSRCGSSPCGCDPARRSAFHELVDERLAAQELHLARERLADLLGYLDRPMVVRTDQADHAVTAEDLEGEVAAAHGSFHGVALAPPRLPQDPAQLEAGPARRIQESRAPDELAGRADLHREHAVAQQLP